MNKQGPMAQSDEEKKRKGTHQPVRSEANRGVLKLEKMEMMGAPDDFSEEEKQSWDIHRDILNRIGLISFADLPLIRELCILHARMGVCNSQIKGQDAIYINQHGNPCKHPFVEIYSNTIGRYLELCSEFGMTPKARSRIGLEGKNKTQIAQEVAGNSFKSFLENKPK